MASAWGKSWGLAFGAAWGIVAAVAPVGGDAAAGIAAPHARHNAPTSTAHPDGAAGAAESLRKRANVYASAQTFTQENQQPPPARRAQAATETIAKQGETAEFGHEVAPALAMPATPNVAIATPDAATTIAPIPDQEEADAQATALLRRQQDELALIMILLEATA